MQLRTPQGATKRSDLRFFCNNLIHELNIPQ